MVIPFTGRTVQRLKERTKEMDGCVISSLKPKYSIKTSLRSLDLFLWPLKAYKSRRYVQTVNTFIVSSNIRALFNLKSVVLLIEWNIKLHGIQPTYSLYTSLVVNRMVGKRSLIFYKL